MHRVVQQQKIAFLRIHIGKKLHLRRKRIGGSVFHVLCIADVLAQPDADSAIAVQVFAILRKSGFDGVGGILRQSTFAHIGDLIVRQGLAPVQGVCQPADAHPEHHGCDDEIDPVVMQPVPDPVPPAFFRGGHALVVPP